MPTWSVPPVLGDGSTAQGGTPPFAANEPAAIDEAGNYTRSQWLAGDFIDRFDNGEAKFRISAAHGFFGAVDPIVYPGQVGTSHYHEFVGNIGLFENGGLAAVANADYAALRNNPKSTATGGPLNATLYWSPALFVEIDGVLWPVKANVVTFYYTNDYADVAKLVRLHRGFSFIGGVNPMDRFNTAFRNSLPDTDLGGGEKWDKTQRYNGWNGWQFVVDGVAVPLAAGNTADAFNSTNARQLVNDDGSDPWGGAAEDPDGILISSLNAPAGWDGINPSSPTGRTHVSYAIRSDQNTYRDVVPQGWFKVPHFEAKHEFPGSRPGLSGHAYRSKLSLSSDNHMGVSNPRGSTMHFDWLGAWDSIIQHTWHSECNGITQDGVPGNPLTCNTSTISATQRMLVGEASPDPTMSLDPVLTFHNYNIGASKNAFGPLPPGTRVSGTVSR